jgi:hypothetical protein
VSFRDVYAAVLTAIRTARGGGGSSPPPSGIPTSANTKAEIVAWLLGRGVDLSASALQALTKAELLSLVVDVTDAENEEG